MAHGSAATTAAPPEVRSSHDDPVVGEKVYTLEGNTSGLDAFAGKSATVTGTVKGETMTVSAVAEPK